MRRFQAIALVCLLACGGTQTQDQGESIGSASSAGGGDSAMSSGDAGETSGTPTSGSEDVGDVGSTGDTGDGDPLVPEPGDSRYALAGETVVLDGSASLGAVSYQWNFDDGSPPLEPSDDPVVEVAYEAPGRYRPVLTVFDELGNARSASVQITVTFEPSHAPVHSSSIVRDRSTDRFAVVSPDSNELTIIGRRAERFEALERFSTCAGPRTVTPLEGRWAVACPGPGVVWIGGGDESPLEIALPYGSRPFGVIAASGRLFVSLQGTGELASIDPSSSPPVVQERWTAVDDARGLALLPDGRIAVSRWRSPDERAEIAIIDPSSGAEPTIATLAFDPKEASDTETGGVPSYLDAIVVSPIGDRLALPSLQANIGQGEHLNDRALTFETTVRGVVSYLELPSLEESFVERKQFDDRGLLSAGVFSSRGDYLFLADRGARAVERIDTFTGGQAGAILGVGFAPQGLALSEDDRFLFVDAYLSREVVVYDVSDFSDLPQPVARISTVSAEPLDPEILRGKQLFNDAFDPRLAKDSYIACAHCHLDGEADRRTWDFTDRGEGLRNTISLLGRAGSAHGPIHWSANFDEVQDFEHDIRGPFGGSGLMSDEDFESGTRNTTLGDPKAGVSEDLDALAAYVTSLGQFPPSPNRPGPGQLSSVAQAGRALFESAALGCTQCHAGDRMTDSAFEPSGEPILHDVGTLSEGSGQRLSGPLSGLDTPTLFGLWNSPPYLHDGSAATLREVLEARNPEDAHGVTSGLSPTELQQLEAYLLSL